MSEASPTDHNLALAQHIARAIFECPLLMGTDRVQRIAFKGGLYPIAETDLGGLNEDGLTNVIERALQRGWE